jgi:hypothetical protein
MTSSSKTHRWIISLARPLGPWAVCVLWFFLGCAAEKADLAPPENSMSSIIRQSRPGQNDIERKGISPEAQAIEMDLGAR